MKPFISVLKRAAHSRNQSRYLEILGHYEEVRIGAEFLKTKVVIAGHVGAAQTFDPLKLLLEMSSFVLLQLVDDSLHHFSGIINHVVTREDILVTIFDLSTYKVSWS